MTSFKATPAGNKSPWLKTFFQNEQRDAFRQHSPPSDSLLDQRSWRRSLTQGTAHHSLHTVKNHKTSSLPGGRRRGSWTGPVLQPGAWPCLGLQLILLSPAGLAGLFAPTPELCIIQLLTLPAGEILMQTEIIYWKVNHFSQSEFTKFKNCQLIQNYIFKPKPEGTILAEENSCWLCLNVDEIFFLPYISFTPIHLKVHSLVLSWAAHHIFPVHLPVFISPHRSETETSYFFLSTWADAESSPGRTFAQGKLPMEFPGRNYLLHGNGNSHKTTTPQKHLQGGESLSCLISAWHHHLAVVSTAMHFEIHWVQNLAQGDQPGKTFQKYYFPINPDIVGYSHWILHSNYSFLPLYTKLQTCCRAAVLGSIGCNSVY